ncbi:MAG: hypothetical protein AAB267_05985 [Candidatus Desantisbacteria bacterium]
MEKAKEYSINYELVLACPINTPDDGLFDLPFETLNYDDFPLSGPFQLWTGNMA